MDSIIKSKWEFLGFCVFSFFAFQYVEDQNIQKWLYFALAIIFWIFSGFGVVNLEKTKLIKKKNNKFCILFYLLLILLLIAGTSMLSYPFSEICLIMYKISFFGLCFLMVAPIIKMPFPNDGVVIRDFIPIRDEWISLIFLHQLDSLPRELQMNYSVKKILNGQIVNELQYKINAKFSSTSFKKIRNTGKPISVVRIIDSILTQTEEAVKKELFDEPINMLQLSYGVEGKIIVTYL